MTTTGTLKSWNDERGFGFIEPENGGQEIFVHIKAFTVRSARPVAGQRLTFQVETTADGKKRAVRVAPVRASRAAIRQRNDSPAQWGTASYFTIPAFLLLYLIVAVLWGVPKWVAGLYVLASFAAFLFYGFDKWAARTGRWRVSEQRLILLGLFGGWPGAIVAQQVMRHKSSKVSFRAAFWVSVVTNVLGFVALNSPAMASFLSGFYGRP